MTTASLSDSEVDRRFEVAVRWVQNKTIQAPIKPSSRQSLFFYGRYKQATSGDNRAPQPYRIQVVRFYMWTAHEKQRGKSRTQAKREYVDELHKLCIEFKGLEDLSPEMLEAAQQFFVEFYGSHRHPLAAEFDNLAAQGKIKLASAASPATVELEESASPKRNGVSATSSPASSRAASSPQQQQQQQPASPLAAPISEQKQDDAPSSNGVAPGHPASPPQNGRPAAAASVVSPASALNAELRDKQVLAHRLQELQRANQAKLQQLEQQMQRAGNPSIAARFATPLRRGDASAPPPSASASSRTFVPQSHLPHLDPSSPFVASWTPGGLAARHPARAAATASRAAPTFSPETPAGQQFQTPYAQARPFGEHQHSAVEAVPYAQMNGHSSPGRTARSPAVSPARPALSASTVAASASAASSSSGGVSGSELDALLATLDSKHAAQVCEFKAAEQRWQEKLAGMEQRQRELQQQIDEGQSGPAHRPRRDPALELTLAVAPDSLLHHAINIAKVVVPLGAAAYAGLTLAAYWQRRAKRT